MNTERITSNVKSFLAPFHIQQVHKLYHFESLFTKKGREYPVIRQINKRIRKDERTNIAMI